MISTSRRRIGAGLLAATGVLHLVLAPEYLDEKTYIGVLFVLGGLTALALAGVLLRVHDRPAWAASGLVAAGMAVGFILSRTVGLPGFHESEWELSGVVSVLLEVGVAALAAQALAVDRDRHVPSLAGQG